MAQSMNLSVSGEYTSINDFNGLPPGALNKAINVESKYKNILEPRRGFEHLPDSSVALTNFIRLNNFQVAGSDKTLAITDTGELQYYTGANPWPRVAGNYSTAITAPDAVYAKSRLIKAGQNLYITSKDGVRSLSSGVSAQTLRAGVPKGLNLEATTNTDLVGFFNNNVVLDTTGSITSGAATILHLDSTTGIQIGQYVTGIDREATLIVQDLTYTSVLFGALGNGITIQYTTGATAGSEVVSVVGTAISVQIASGVSTAAQVRTALMANSSAMVLVAVSVSGTATNPQTAPTGPTALTGGLDNTIPVGTKVLSITDPATVVIETGTTTAGSASISALASIAGIVPGIGVAGEGIPEGAKVVSTSGSGPYTALLDLAAFKTATGTNLTFTSPMSITMDQNALLTLTGTPISFYSGSQVGYRIVFGRIETDNNGNTITRLGSPSAIGIANNISPTSINTTITTTIPKNSEEGITFYQLYRSPQTDDIDITPLDQYNLVAEVALTPQNFIDRILTITDSTPDSLKGIPLYAGSDREGILQANNPPPMAWDICPFRDFMLYANITQPTSAKVTIVSVGAPNGIQIGDTITFSGTLVGVPFTRTYTAAAAENALAQEFQVVTAGTPSQNITDTANSLIRVINYDNDLEIHAILLSSSTDLPGQILFEADNASYDAFTVNASAHTSAFDPQLFNISSKINTVTNGILVSKAGELEATPSTNLIRVGDSSSPILRCIPLRDYAIILKTDGIYKLQGFTPDGLLVNPFDLTTKIIGADTAVALNSAVWMLSNQGVVSISDGGVEAKSIPIDDQFNRLIGTYLDTVTNLSFAVGYESERKYILSVPTADNDPITSLQYIYNYVTTSWTKWERRLRAGHINTLDGKLYISRGDGTENGVSKERKTGTYRDFVDEGNNNTIVSLQSPNILEVASTNGVAVGDILYKSDTAFSPILAIDYLMNYITVQSALDWALGDVQILSAFECSIEWKQVFGDNPAFVRQYSEGLALFKNTRFNTAALDFVTDYSGSSEPVTVFGSGNGLWGMFPWASIPFGGAVLPDTIRFLIPQNKQMGSFLIPSIKIKQGFSDFKFQGLAITYFNASNEVGL